MSTDTPESHKDSPTADGGQDKEPQANPDVAEELARERLVQSLWSEIESSDVDELVTATRAISLSLRDGQVPDNSDLAHARWALDEIEKRLDDLSHLYGLSRHLQDVKWGKLSEEEKRKIIDAEEVDDGGE